MQRLIDSFVDDEDFNRLSPNAEVFFRRLWNECDDFGRFDGRGVILKSRLYPLRDVRIPDIARFLDECVKAGLIATYAVDAKPIIQIRRFRNTKNTRSNPKYPAMPEQENLNDTTGKSQEIPNESKENTDLISIDINCNQLISTSKNDSPSNIKENIYNIGYKEKKEKVIKRKKRNFAEIAELASQNFADNIADFFVDSQNRQKLAQKFSEFAKVRLDMGEPLKTIPAGKYHAGKVRKAINAGFTVDEICELFDRSIANGWQDWIYPDDFLKRNAVNNRGVQKNPAATERRADNPDACFCLE